MKYLGRIPVEDSTAGREARADAGWTDGMLSVLRRDPRGLAVARMTIRRSGAEGAGFLDRSLAAFESELRGTERPAADSLAVLDLAATETELFAGRDAYARSIDHLAASRLLLEAGDTSRAVRLLTWHEAKLDPEFSRSSLHLRTTNWPASRRRRTGRSRPATTTSNSSDATTCRLPPTSIW